MKRGIRHQWIHNPPIGVREIPVGMEIEGIPVFVDRQYRGIAEARGVWPLKSIMVGPAWFGLDGDQQQATLLHEVWHCKRLHLEARILLLPFFWTKWVRRIAAKQELAADDYAARNGYAMAMMSIVSLRPASPPYYPTLSERLGRLARYLRETHHEAA